jgi:hypothetical protein
LAASTTITPSRTLSVSADETKVLRTRGIVIEARKGRPRLLLGAPIPRTEGPKRRDDLTSGIVLLEENGADRLVVGDAIQPQILGSVGKRSGYITTGDDALLTLDYAASDAFHLTAGIDSGSLMLRAPGGRPRAMGVTEGDRPAKLLFFAQGDANMLRVDVQTPKRLPPAHSDKEFFDAIWNTNP